MFSSYGILATRVVVPASKALAGTMDTILGCAFKVLFDSGMLLISKECVSTRRRKTLSSALFPLLARPQGGVQRRRQKHHRGAAEPVLRTVSRRYPHRWRGCDRSRQEMAHAEDGPRGAKPSPVYGVRFTATYDKLSKVDKEDRSFLLVCNVVSRMLQWK